MTRHNVLDEPPFDAAADLSGHDPRAGLPAGRGPRLEATYWGYALVEDMRPGPASLLAAGGGRFLGAILLMAAAGLWMMPDAMRGPDVLAMKLALSVMFAVLGGALLWAGGRGGAREIQIDTVRGELRIGRREPRGAFRLRGRLGFDEVSSVFLLRSKERGAEARLFLRVGGGDQALELGRGDEPRLEALRARLARDLARSPREVRPVERRLARHAMLAA